MQLLIVRLQVPPVGGRMRSYMEGSAPCLTD